MNRQNDNQLPEISEAELWRRVIYAFMRPPVEFGRQISISLKEILGLLEMAYFHRLRDNDLKLTEIAEFLGISRRKAVQLSNKLKQNFSKSDQPQSLKRRILFMLWAGPMTEGRIAQALSDVDKDEVTEALVELEREDRVIKEGGRTPKYSTPTDEFRLYRDNWMAKIDGLNNLLQNLTNAVVGRFFDDEENAFARTVTFRMPKDATGELKRFYEETIWPKLVELDEASKEADETEKIDLSILWAPFEYLEQRGNSED